MKRSKTLVINKGKQQGVATIELALISVFLVIILLFSCSVVLEITLKGKLDRVSFSAVNILKSNPNVLPIQIYKFISQSLTRSGLSCDKKNLLVRVEVLNLNEDSKNRCVYIGNNTNIKENFGLTLKEKTHLDGINKLLVSQTSWGQFVVLYQISVVYKFENLDINLFKNEWFVRSNSITLG